VIDTDQQSDQHDDGFSLIELIVVVCIIAIVMASASFVFHSARVTAGNSSATSVAKAYRGAVEEFTTDHQGRPPRVIGSVDWPIAKNGPVTTGGLARQNGRYLRSFPESVTDGSIGIGAGGNFGYITYRVVGTKFAIEAVRKNGTKVCSSGTIAPVAPLQPCEKH